MIKKLLITILTFFTFSNANALNIQYEEYENKLEYFNNENYKYAGENKLVKLYINENLIYDVNAEYFDKIRFSPIRMDLKESDSDTKTVISYMYFNCLTKQNMIIFLHVYDKNGKFLKEEKNDSLEWVDTEEKTNFRLLNEYICKK